MSEYSKQSRRRATPQENFTTVAHRYDRLNNILTLGSINRIRKRAIRFIKHDAQSVLDMCCGTGEMGRLIRKAHPSVVLTGVDINQAMLNQAVKKCSYDFLLLQTASCKTALAPKYDAIVLSFAYHDLASLRFEVLDLLYRKLSINGCLISVELSLPNNKWFRLPITYGLKIARVVFRCIGLKILVHTIEEILESPDSLLVIEEFRTKGFIPRENKSFLFGLVQVNVYMKGT